MEELPTLYVFLDEGGDFNFSRTGSKYFTLTSVSMRRPFALHTDLDTYKYDLIEFRKQPRIALEYFHCADDNRYVKAKMFSMLAAKLPNKTVDSVIVEKSKTGPALREPEKFFPKMLGYLLRFAMQNCPDGIGEVVVITDTIPVNRNRKAIEKALKQVLKRMLDGVTPYRVMHHGSRSHYGLQIADYLNWAVFRKWEHGDCDSYNVVRHLIRSEFDIFRTGVRHYYEF